MTTRTRIVLALLGCLVLGGNAVAADLSHCDRVCCDTPCDTAPLAPDDCACCVVRSAGLGDPLLPSVTPAAPQPALAPALPDLPVFTAAAERAEAGATPVALAVPPLLPSLRL